MCLHVCYFALCICVVLLSVWLHVVGCFDVCFVELCCVACVFVVACLMCLLFVVVVCIDLPCCMYELHFCLLLVVYLCCLVVLCVCLFLLFHPLFTFLCASCGLRCVCFFCISEVF